MSTYAAAVAYRGLFAFMLILVVLVGVLGSPDSFDRLVVEPESRSSQQVSRQLQPVVEQGKEQVESLEEIIEQAQKQAKSELLLFGVAVALWSVSVLASTLADAFNTAYGLTETRRGWKRLALILAPEKRRRPASVRAYIVTPDGTTGKLRQVHKNAPVGGLIC